MILFPEKTYNFYATCFRGLEESFAGELKALDCAEIRPDREIVFFKTSLKNAWRLNYLSRLANKIVLVVDSRELRGIEDLHKQSLSVAWEDLFDLGRTFKVDSSCVFSRIDNTLTCNLKVKDGIADRFNKKFGKRPDVERDDADVHVDCRIYKNESLVGLNLSGERLFKRGYRQETNAAPLKETLAAGIAGFAMSAESARAGGQVFKRIIDPMAGSGTLIIETAMALLNIPSGAFRRGFSFQKLKSYVPEIFAGIKKKADEGVKLESEREFLGCDQAPAFLENLKTNISAAKLSGRVKILRQDFFNPVVDMTDSLILFNPPFGERMKGAPDIGDFYRRIGDTMKKYCRGSTVYIFTEHGPNIKSVGLRSSRSIPLFNGKIECRLLEYKMY